MQSPLYRYVTGARLADLRPLLQTPNDSAWQPTPDGFGVPYANPLPATGQVPLTAHRTLPVPATTTEGAGRTLSSAVLVLAAFPAPVYVSLVQQWGYAENIFRRFYFGGFQLDHDYSVYGAQSVQRAIYLAGEDLQFVAEGQENGIDAGDCGARFDPPRLARYVATGYEQSLAASDIFYQTLDTPYSCTTVINRLGINAQEAPTLTVTGGCGTPVVASWEPTRYVGYGIAGGLQRETVSVAVVGAGETNTTETPLGSVRPDLYFTSNAPRPSGEYTVQAYTRPSPFVHPDVQYRSALRAFRVGIRLGAPSGVTVLPDSATRSTQIRWDLVTGATGYVVRRDGLVVYRGAERAWRDAWDAAAGVGGIAPQTPAHVYSVSATNHCGEGPQTFAAGAEIDHAKPDVS